MIASAPPGTPTPSWCGDRQSTASGRVADKRHYDEATERLTDGDKTNAPVLLEAGNEGCPTEERNNVSWDLTPRDQLAEGGEGTKTQRNG